MQKFLFTLIAVLVLTILVHMFYVRKESWFMSERPFDIVYTWVDSSDPVFMDIKDTYAAKEGKLGESNSSARYEMREELRYSLRSLERYCPNFRTVFIVVADGQTPQFLDVSHPALRIVKHSEIIPEDFLPTFNSLCIESFIHLIPGLSDRYVYFNDDIILTGKMRFFDNSGNPFVGYEKINRVPKIDYEKPPEYVFLNMVSWNLQYLKKKYNVDVKALSMHGPSPCIKADEAVMIDRDEPELKHTARSRFRATDNLAFNSVIRPVYYKDVLNYPCNKFGVIIVDASPDFLKRLQESVNSEKFQVVVINSMDEKDVAGYHRIMKNRFPQPSRFEMKPQLIEFNRY
jgi:hypothetical protein